MPVASIFAASAAGTFQFGSKRPSATTLASEPLKDDVVAEGAEKPILVGRKGGPPRRASSAPGPPRQAGAYED